MIIEILQDTPSGVWLVLAAVACAVRGAAWSSDGERVRGPAAADARAAGWELGQTSRR
jgi:hypothetical protein